MRPLFLVVLASVPLHVEPTVTEAPAGSRAELGFTVEHGCAGSPTVEVAMRLPLEVADPEPVALEGWTTTVAPPDADGHVVVTWAGGPLPDGEAATFAVSVGLPSTPGVTLLFPTVQRCEEGELAWISEEGGASEADNPAPRITLTELDPTNSTSTTAAASTTTSTGEAVPAPASSTRADDEEERSGAGAALAAAVVSVVVAGGLAYGYGRVRRSRTGGRPPRS